MVIVVVDTRVKVVEEDQLMGDMVVVNVVDVKMEVEEEDQLMNDHVRFGTYHRLDFEHQS